ncbi:MAG: RNA polymerase sigma factor [Burkholderiales bacterium]|nr:RNA polymerase sigma factor [Burkholderiales bacterium]
MPPACPQPPPHAAAQAPRAQRDACLAGWLAQAAQGNAQAFEQFYDATAAPARALAVRLLRGPDIDDVLAEAYFQAWREAARFDVVRGSAVTWLLTLVRSRALDLLRRQRHAARAPAGAAAGEDPQDLLACPLPGPEDLLSLAEAGGRLATALATLSAQERWVLGLAYFRELSHAAIAQATGLPLGSVKSLLTRAQHKLRTRLNA